MREVNSKWRKSDEEIRVYLTGIILIFMMTVFAFIFSLHAISGNNIKQLERTNNVLILCEEAIIENTRIKIPKNKF